MDSTKFLALIISLIPPLFASSINVNLEFPSFTVRNLTLLGDSYLRNGVVGLTTDLGVPSSSSGTVLYSSPIPFSNPETNTTASFSTRFAFSITNQNPTSFGDGLTFFLSPDNQTLGSPGAFLGLLNSSRLNNTRFIAIEFDTMMDLQFNDPDNNHVGLDIDSLVSIKTVNPMLSGINLKSGNVITAWIDYSDRDKKIEAFLSYSSLKPDDPILTVDVDLTDYLQQFMFIGFSASTEGSTELHYIENWSFQTLGLRHVEDRIQSNTSMPPSQPGNRHHSHRHTSIIRLWLGIAIPGFIVCVILAVVFIRKGRSWEPELVAGPKQFDYKQLKLATRGFHQSRILGHGAFGTVYKAFFPHLDMISAVKRSKHMQEGKTEFLSELSIIAYLRHKNLVQLQGWCIEKGELLLVYEFMPNGSLDKALYRDIEPLKWIYRYNIAVGLASALTYLHEECEQQVIHRDIKASNVMLDGSYNARLGDFGLARLMDHDKSPVSTLTAGTMGYLAPEYLQYGKVNEKTDVFSYGVVVLELACGRRPIQKDGQEMVNLVDWVWRLHSEGKILSAVDAGMRGEFDESEMKKLLLLGLNCANPDCAGRPSMRKVLQILNDEAEMAMVPKAKPCLTFSHSLPLSINEIFSDSDDDDDEGSSESELEIRFGLV